MSKGTNMTRFVSLLAVVTILVVSGCGDEPTDVRSAAAPSDARSSTTTDGRPTPMTGGEPLPAEPTMSDSREHRLEASGDLAGAVPYIVSRTRDELCVGI